MTLDAETFIGRFLLHILPTGMQKIRFYGWMARTVPAPAKFRNEDGPAPAKFRNEDGPAPAKFRNEDGRTAITKPSGAH